MEDIKVSFDQLPMVTLQLRDEVRELKSLVLALTSANETDKPKTWLNLTELCEYLPDHPTKQTVYGWVSNRTIPYYKVGRRLSFLQKEIDDWVAGTYKKTADQMRQQALESHGYKKGGIL